MISRKMSMVGGTILTQTTLCDRILLKMFLFIHTYFLLLCIALLTCLGTLSSLSISFVILWPPLISVFSLVGFDRTNLKRWKIVCSAQGLSEGKTGNKKREREREQRKPWIVLLLTPLSFPSRVAGRACRVVLRVTTSKWVFSSRA